MNAGSRPPLPSLTRPALWDAHMYRTDALHQAGVLCRSDTFPGQFVGYPLRLLPRCTFYDPQDDLSFFGAGSMLCGTVVTNLSSSLRHPYGGQPK